MERGHPCPHVYFPLAQADKDVRVPLEHQNIIYIAIKRIIMRDHKKLIEMRDAADLLGEIFAAFGVHFGGWLVEKRNPDVAQLF